MINKILLIIGVTLIYSLNVYSQNNRYVPFSIDQAKTLNPPSEVSSSVDDAVILDVNFNIVRNIIQQKIENINLEIPVNASRTVIANLKKFEVLAPGAKIVSGTRNGDREIQFNEFAAYVGNIPELENSHIAISFFDGYVSGIMTTKNDSYVLGKLGENGDANYILYRVSKMKVHHDFQCGSEALEIPSRISDIQKSLSPRAKDFSTSTLLKADIAVESDYETYERFGNSVQNASQYLLSLMVPVSAIYVRDVNVQLFVSYIRVWSDINDPYSGTTSFQLLSQFRSYWNANMQNVPRTLAHYICTRPGGLGGVAWLDVLCSPIGGGGYGYAFSDIDGNFQPLPTYTWDVMVVAHETGHNFGSPHTHNCGWPGGPIDTCYQPEGGCYNGPAIPRQGTIMSYCHLNGSIMLDFGPLPEELMRTNAEAASCMGTLNFLVAYPNGGEIYRSGTTGLIIWGCSITSNVNVEYSTNNGGNWNTIQNNVPATQRNVNWSIPLMPTTTQARVRVYESGNPSNGDICDSVFQIRPYFIPFNMVSPPQFTRIYTSPTDTTRIHFIWTKTTNLPEIRYRWNLTNFNGTLNYNQFSNSGGTDSVCSVRISRIDSTISNWGIQTGDSLRGRWFVKAYSQLDSASSINSLIITFIRSVIGINPISTEVPKEFYVNQNYPNPFNPLTKIRFGLPKSAHVKIAVYDILGKEISILVNQRLETGSYETDWDGTNHPSGIYFYKIVTKDSFGEAEHYVNIKKMILVK